MVQREEDTIKGPGRSFRLVMGVLVILLIFLSFVAYRQFFIVQGVLYSPQEDIQVDYGDSISVNLGKSNSSSVNKEGVLYLYIVLLSFIILIVLVLLVLFFVYRRNKNRFIAAAKLHVQEFRIRGYSEEETRQAFLGEGWKNKEINTLFIQNT